MTLGQQNLQKYLDDISFMAAAAGTHEVAAAWLGISRAYLTQIVNGARIPSGKLAANIHNKTGVDPIDWYQEAKSE